MQRQHCRCCGSVSGDSLELVSVEDNSVASFVGCFLVSIDLGKGSVNSNIQKKVTDSKSFVAPSHHALTNVGWPDNMYV